MVTGTSKMLIPEPFTGSNDIESYITHSELLAKVETNGDAGPKRS